MVYYCPNCGTQIVSIAHGCGYTFDRVKCGNCKNWIPISDVCPYCGKDITWVICPKCGGTISSFTCPTCGKVIPL
jgi:predicted RNA-binding Zn-ribbon protein involved in translation (DUF1610 family)